MTIKFANYAAFTEAGKQVAREVQAFRQMMGTHAPKTAAKSTKSTTAQKRSPDKKGPAK
ncbi:hypothetical protein [Burkholderia ubonensis]|uniref:hypothetical protein n=1 Tax=Burkholderia ubonensis TaxID=101571 RepID=UPI000A927A99|nr:hypothetical protein [Burkholderia ubonensis]